MENKENNNTNTILRSSYPPVDIPEVALTPWILAQARNVIEGTGDLPLFIQAETGKSFTVEQTLHLIPTIASALAAKGVGKGTVVAICAPNSIEFPIVIHGVILLGGCVTTLNPLYTPHEIARQLTDSQATHIWTVLPLLPKINEAIAETNVKTVFLFGEDRGETNFCTFESLVAVGDPNNVPEVEINAKEDVCFLPYSSGTTGLPKGVMLTHYNAVANILQTRHLDQFQEDGEKVVQLGLLPMFHVYGLWMVNSSIHGAFPMVVMTKYEFEPFLKTMEKYKVTHAGLAPPIILMMTKSDLTANYQMSLKVVGSAAASLGLGICQQFQEKFNCILRQGYGMTELSPCGTYSSIKKKIIFESVGHLVPNTEARLVDIDTGRDIVPEIIAAATEGGEGGAAPATNIKDRKRGELWIRGPQVMKGYLNREEATKETLTPDGWLKTGDIASVDEEGYFYIVDRLKELIKYKGNQVPPAELEAILLQHEGIADAACVSSWDDDGEEVPKAFIVRRVNSTATAVTAEEVMQFVADRVAPFKRIRKVEFVEQIPKTLSGKILRVQLKEKEREEAEKRKQGLPPHSQ